MVLGAPVIADVKGVRMHMVGKVVSLSLLSYLSFPFFGGIGAMFDKMAMHAVK